MNTKTIYQDVAPGTIDRASIRLHIDRRNWLALLFAACVIGAFAGVERSYSVFIVFVLFLVVGFLIVGRKDATAANLFLIVYSVSAIAAVALYAIYVNRYGVPYYVGGSDDLTYELTAREVANRLGIFEYTSIRGKIVRPSHNSVGYVYMVSLLYRLGELFGGFQTMIPRLFNGMCLGILSVFSYRLALRLQYERQTAATTGLFSGLLPVMVYNAVHTFRDVSIALLLLIGVYIWTPRSDSFSTGSSVLRWAITLFLVLALSELRFYHSIVLLIVAFVGDVVVSSRSSSHKQRLYAFFFVIATAVLLWTSRGDITFYAEQLEEVQEEYTEYRTDLSEGLSTYVFTAPLPLGYILRVGYALITPLPVASLAIDRLLLSLGTLVQYFFLPFLGFGFFWSLRRPKMLPLLIAFILLFGGMALITFTGRHIVQFLPYGVIITAAGYKQYRHYRDLIWILLSCVGIGLLVVYIFLKI